MTAATEMAAPAKPATTVASAAAAVCKCGGTDY
jgi:hypothetical protein